MNRRLDLDSHLPRFLRWFGIDPILLRQENPETLKSAGVWLVPWETPGSSLGRSEAWTLLNRTELTLPSFSGAPATFESSFVIQMLIHEWNNRLNLYVRTGCGINSIYTYTIIYAMYDCGYKILQMKTFSWPFCSFGFRHESIFI